MAIFRCPSASSTSTSSTQHVQTKIQTSKIQKPHAPSRRTRSDTVKAMAAAKNAARLARARKMATIEGSFSLFIGNFPPDTEKHELEAYFRLCGKIRSIEIRCCGGVCAPTTRAPDAFYHVHKVRQYALMTFTSKLARSKALKLAGSVLRGYALAVCLSITDLPELREMITERMNNYRLKIKTPDANRAKKSVLKPLDLEPTVLLDPQEQRAAQKRHRGVVLDQTFHLTVI